MDDRAECDVKTAECHGAVELVDQARVAFDHGRTGDFRLRVGCGGACPPECWCKASGPRADLRESPPSKALFKARPNPMKPPKATYYTQAPRGETHGSPQPKALFKARPSPMIPPKATDYPLSPGRLAPPTTTEVEVIDSPPRMPRDAAVSRSPSPERTRPHWNWPAGARALRAGVS